MHPGEGETRLDLNAQGGRKLATVAHASRAACYHPTEKAPDVSHQGPFDPLVSSSTRRGRRMPEARGIKEICEGGLTARGRFASLGRPPGPVPRALFLNYQPARPLASHRMPTSSTASTMNILFTSSPFLAVLPRMRAVTESTGHRQQLCRTGQRGRGFGQEASVISRNELRLRQPDRLSRLGSWLELVAETILDDSWVPGTNQFSCNGMRDRKHTLTSFLTVGDNWHETGSGD